MDEKREFLMQQLFGSSDSGDSALNLNAQQLQRLARAQEKANKINEALEDSERSAAILRKMMSEE